MLGAIGIAVALPGDQLPIMCATQFAMLATIGQVVTLLALGRKVDKVLWVSLVIIVLMGAATLIFHDPAIIKWRPTVMDWFFGLTLLVSEFVFGKNLIQAMLAGQIDLPSPVWRRLNLSWALFFVASGMINLFVALNYSEEAWVRFHMFGGLGLMLLFMVGQGVYLMRYLEAPTDVG